MRLRLRTPAGRPVTILNLDCTKISVQQTEDAFAQFQTYSGERGDGHCLLFSNITDSAGALVAVTPGPNISCTPRGGDGTSMGVQLALAGNSGFVQLIRGTPRVGVALIHDRGYLHDAPNVNRGSNPTLSEWCEANDVLNLSRVKAGEKCLRYATVGNLVWTKLVLPTITPYLDGE